MQIEKLKQEHTLTDLPTAHLLLRYDKNEKIWEFAGYRCDMCGVIIKSKQLMYKHKCAKYTKKKDRDKEL
jgi:hypothetical protein